MAELFDKQLITNVSEIYQRVESKPDIVLYTPTFEPIGIIGTYYNSNCTMRFNDKSEFSFSFPYSYVNEYGKEETNIVFDKIARTQLLHISGLGWWYIDSVSFSNDGTKRTCDVNAYSYEHTLTLRSVNLYSKKQSDENTMVMNLYGIMTAFKEQTGWKLPQGYYDNPSVYTFTNRMFNIELNTSWYDFLKNDVQSAFDCFVFFDYENLQIDIKTSYSQVYLRESELVLSFDNLMKNVQVTEESQRTATALYVTGSNFNIIDVNPLGSSIVYNFDNYLTTDWMSQSTISAINTWKNKIESYKEVYKNLTGFRNYLIEMKVLINTQLTKVESDVLKYKELLSLSSTTVNNAYDHYSETYKLCIAMRNGLQQDFDILNKSIDILNSKSSNDCYNDLKSLLDGTLFLVGHNITQYSKYDWQYDTVTTSSYWKKYEYAHLDFRESFDSDGSFNIFKLGKNPYGGNLLNYYNSHNNIPTIPYIVNQLSWNNNFTKPQLKEIGRYIIDASYNASEYSYYDGTNYTNYIYPFECQLGELRNAYAHDTPNPDDGWCYGLRYWSTNFINLPDGEYNLSLRFFNKQTGEEIVPHAVNLYTRDKGTGVIKHYDNTACQSTKEWSNLTGKSSDFEPCYMRACFPFPESRSEANNAIPFQEVVCILGNKYSNPVTTNIDNETALMKQAEEKHKELALPCITFDIDVVNFLKLEEYSIFAKDLCLGANVKAELYDGKYTDVRLLELNFSFDDVTNLSMSFGNKFGIDNDKIMFRKLVGSSGDTYDIQNSFTSFSYVDNELM